MTGFGAASSDSNRKGSAALRAEVRSVNHKFLLVKVRLPQELSFLEIELEDAVRRVLERGAVQVNVFASGSVGVETVAIDAAAAKRYCGELEALARELALEPDVHLETLLQLPGVIGTGVDAGTLQRREREVLGLVERALAELQRMRATEGAAIAKDLEKHCRAIEKLVEKIEKRMPAVVKGHQEALRKRVEDLLAGKAGKGQLAAADLAREVALLADRLDVSEELSRLASHLVQFRELVAKSGPVGRQLDFLVQELFRETNTIGSKCSDASVAHVVVELKTLIERLREQVQNVE